MGEVAAKPTEGARGSRTLLTFCGIPAPPPCSAWSPCPSIGGRIRTGYEISCTSFRLIASENAVKSSATIMNAPGPPITDAA